MLLVIAVEYLFILTILILGLVIGISNVLNHTLI